MSTRQILNRFRLGPFGLVFLLLIVLPACGPVISKELRKTADLALSFQQVFQNPDAYKGKTVIWGGEIIETINQKDRSTLIEVLQRPLNWLEEPRRIAPSEGRFLVLNEGYLDPYIFRTGKKLTVAGEILGEKIKTLGEMNYRYPLLRCQEIFLWKDLYDYPYPPYHPYHPSYLSWWHHGWWSPGWRWGYPYYWHYRR